jgi:hypothetical protein
LPKSPRITPFMITKKINFIVEQDGPSEQELKNLLYIYFIENSTISKVFLVRVSYDDSPEEHVALCIREDKGNREEIFKEVGRLFNDLFGSHEHLDVLFVSSDQEKDLLKISSPFYQRGQF